MLLIGSVFTRESVHGTHTYPSSSTKTKYTESYSFLCMRFYIYICVLVLCVQNLALTDSASLKEYHHTRFQTTHTHSHAQFAGSSTRAWAPLCGGCRCYGAGSGGRSARHPRQEPSTCMPPELAHADSAIEPVRCLSMRRGRL